MSFSSIADMLSAVQERTQPLYAVIRDDRRYGTTC